MTYSLSAIRAGLATQLATIDGLNVTSVMPDRVSVPMAVVGQVRQTFHQTMGDLHQLEVKVRIYVSRADSEAGQGNLDAYLSPGAQSIKDALEAGRGDPGQPALDGAAADLVVTEMDGYGVYDVAGTAYLGAEFTVLVYASGS